MINVKNGKCAIRKKIPVVSQFQNLNTRKYKSNTIDRNYVKELYSKYSFKEPKCVCNSEGRQEFEEYFIGGVITDDNSWVVKRGEYCVLQEYPCITLDGIKTSKNFRQWHDMYLIKRDVTPGSMNPWIDCGNVYNNGYGEKGEKIDCDGIK